MIVFDLCAEIIKIQSMTQSFQLMAISYLNLLYVDALKLCDTLSQLGNARVKQGSLRQSYLIGTPLNKQNQINKVIMYL